MTSVVLTLMAILVFPSFPQQSSGSERVVNVTLTEWKIDMPTTLPAGVYSLKIINSGTHSHTLKIKTKNFEAKLSRDLKPGQGAELKVDLKPGTYKVDCPIGFGPFDHGSKGMELQLIVSPSVS